MPILGSGIVTHSIRSARAEVINLEAATGHVWPVMTTLARYCPATPLVIKASLTPKSFRRSKADNLDSRELS